MNEWPSVTTVLRPFFDATYGALDTDPSIVSEIPCGCKRYGRGNEYTRRGQAVGDAMDVLVSGGDLSDEWLAWFHKHEAWIPFLEAGRKYLRENPPPEKPITQMHLEDKLQRVKGHIDWVWPNQGRVLDVKTGSVEPPEWLGMQTGEYAVLADIHFNVRFYRREILWLRSDGDYRIIPHENPHDALDFNDLLRAHWVMRARLNGKH